MANGLITEHDDTDDGKTVFSAEEHQSFRTLLPKLSDKQIEDWSMAHAEGRVVDAQPAAEDTPEGRIYTREEYEAAAKHPERMTREEFKDWETAYEEGRVKD